MRKGGGGERPVVSFTKEPTRAGREERDKGGSTSRGGRGGGVLWFIALFDSQMVRRRKGVQRAQTERGGMEGGRASFLVISG